MASQQGDNPDEAASEHAPSPEIEASRSDVPQAEIAPPEAEASEVGQPVGEDSGAGSAVTSPVRVEPVVVPRWVQAIVVAVALFGLAALARAAAPVLLIFLVAAVIALIVNPLVTVLQRARVPRGLAIGVVFVVFFAVLAGAVALLVRPVAAQISAFQADFPRLIDSANTSLAELQGWLDARGIGIQVKRPGETALQTLQAEILRGSGDVVAFTRDLVTLIVEAGFMLILTLVITIYMLLYGQQIGALARQVMPPGDGTIEDDYPSRVQRAVSGYVRGQFLFSLIMGLSAGIALWLFGVFGIFPAGRTYAVFFGVFYGLMELIPYLGPVLGATPAVLVALFQGEPLTALWLVLLFVVLQQLEGHIVAPQVFSHSLRINPLIVIFALLLGGHLHGIPGALVALPLAAIARETLIYLRRHLMMEPWGTPSAAALRSPPPALTRATAGGRIGRGRTPDARGAVWSPRALRDVLHWRPRLLRRSPDDSHSSQSRDTDSPPGQ
jgi:predicted PurR-regulated permease PerM